MPDLERVKLAAREPRRIASELNRRYHRFRSPTDYNAEGIDVFEEDWDNLLILDACRFDMFRELSTLPGDLSKRRSRGLSTTEFLQGNFAGDLTDTVYVTANPQFHRYHHRYDTDLHRVIHLWQDGWHGESNSVLPETVTERALEAAEEYPNRRLVVHYIQPHYPFLDSDTEFDKGIPDGEDVPPSFWQQIMRGQLSVPTDRIWEAYRRNLKRALPHVEELMTELDGKTVVTSDHGNVVGERAFPLPIEEWGHPAGQHLPQLVKVPWLVHEGETRRRIVAGEADADAEDVRVDDDAVASRLQQLGYVE